MWPVADTRLVAFGAVATRVRLVALLETLSVRLAPQELISAADPAIPVIPVSLVAYFYLSLFASDAAQPGFLSRLVSLPVYYWLSPDSGYSTSHGRKVSWLVGPYPMWPLPPGYIFVWPHDLDGWPVTSVVHQECICESGKLIGFHCRFSPGVGTTLSGHKHNKRGISLSKQNHKYLASTTTGGDTGMRKKTPMLHSDL